MGVYFGIDQLLSMHPSWKIQALGLVTNHAATTREGLSSRKALLDKGYHLTKLFSPEHGLDVMGADGHLMKDGTDALTGLPVISLYSEKLMPADEDVADLAYVLYDIPDVGSRFYTYLWTLTYVMEACAKNNKPLIILDRPNPISGMLSLAEGPILDETQASFIGRWPIPIRHSCTLGELAVYFNAERGIGCELEIIRCEGWKREYFQPDWQLPFVPTSPAIRHFNSMLLYPGMCLLEATNISEGRGTDEAFYCVGAPWINGTELASILQIFESEGVDANKTSFTPRAEKYAGQVCQGVRWTLNEILVIRPVFLGLLLIWVVKDKYPASFNWAPYPTLVNPSGNQHLDKLLGITGSEKLFDLPLNKFMQQVTRLTRCAEWEEIIEPYLLYQ